MRRTVRKWKIAITKSWVYIFIFGFIRLLLGCFLNVVQYWIWPLARLWVTMTHNNDIMISFTVEWHTDNKNELAAFVKRGNLKMCVTFFFFTI